MQLGALTQLEMMQAAASVNGPDVIPFNLAAGASDSFFFSDITVPDTEMWAVSFAGGFLANSSPDVDLNDVRAVVIRGNKILELQFRGDGTNQLPIASLREVSVPTIFTNGVSRLSFSVQLSGIVLWPSDVVRAEAVFTNTGLGAQSIDAAYFGIRFSPIKLVSDLEVARLVQVRSQGQLDARLISSRG